MFERGTRRTFCNVLPLMRKAQPETHRQKQDWSEDRRAKPRSIRSSQPHQFRHSVKGFFFCSVPSVFVLYWEPNFVYNKQNPLVGVHLYTLLVSFVSLLFFFRATHHGHPKTLPRYPYLCMYHRIICPSGTRCAPLFEIHRMLQEWLLFCVTSPSPGFCLSWSRLELNRYWNQGFESSMLCPNNKSNFRSRTRRRTEGRNSPMTLVSSCLSTSLESQLLKEKRLY